MLERVSAAASSIAKRHLVSPRAGSSLGLAELRLAETAETTTGDPDADTLLYVSAGEGELAVPDAAHRLAPGSAAFVPAGDTATLRAGSGALTVLRASIGPDSDRHAPLGPVATVARSELAESRAATGSRSFQVLFGPENGCTRATLFLGRVPPGRAPWHYHLYDEIVWVPEGPCRLHLESGVEDVASGGAFRLSPRELHIVENAGEAPMTLLGLFTPAGSPSAAYLPVSP